MGYVQRVIILNKPLKVFGFEPRQLILLSVWVVSGLIIAGRFPQDWKFHNFPIGVWFFILWMCGAVAVVMGTRLKPFSWWKNILTYRLGLAPNLYVSRAEPAPIYPDGNIIEVKKTKESFYVQAENTTADPDDFYKSGFSIGHPPVQVLQTDPLEHPGNPRQETQWHKATLHHEEENAHLRQEAAAVVAGVVAMAVGPEPAREVAIATMPMTTDLMMT